MNYDPLASKRRLLKRQRRRLIGTGTPLTVALFAMVGLNGGVWAVVLGLCGGYVATRTWDMIVTHEPALDDPRS